MSLTRPTIDQRSSGVLLHPTSLPSPYGIGDLGPSAVQFADFLHAAGQRWWQMLPMGPTGPGNSPYQPFSAFAGNPLLLSPDSLLEEGLLTKQDLPSLPSFPLDAVDYPKAEELKKGLLEKAFFRFAPALKRNAAYKDFAEAQREWLEDYALFAAIKEDQKGRAWTEWDPALRQREASALEKARRKLASRVDYHTFLQFEFHRQWRRLKGACEEKEVALIGDLPIFVSLDSADAWSHPEIFRLTEERKPEAVSGVPPDIFSPTGQLWGNPLYDWRRLAEQNYSWWVQRCRRVFELFDVVRLDHFIGFHRFWEIPYGERTAVNGRYVPGPGAQLFEEILKQLPEAAFIAEDLGNIIPEVTALREQFRFPGMKVLQFAFSDVSDDNPFLPHNYTPNAVVYTGTHDNNTTVGWFRSDTTKEERAFARAYLKTPKGPIPWKLIELAYESSANITIIPMQDFLGLGAEARMNYPGKLEGNWLWRMRPDALNADLVKTLRSLAETTYRA